MIILLSLGLSSLFFTYQYFIEMGYVYSEARINSLYFNNNSHSLESITKKRKRVKSLSVIINSQKPWNDLGIQEKLLFFDLWFAFSLIGDCIQIWGCFEVLS